ncbi:MAG: sugar phosphate isomerase/epimerase [Spirochaetales bacterium]|jgi:sugar phosphate isomerase/epimerase|nr:sugar phosphate isomerase/epimerase [Spirochaetales bacterium]
MNVFMSSACQWRMKMPDIIRFASSAGFSGLEVWTEHPRGQETALRLGQMASDSGLRLSAHAASWDLNICSHNAAIRQASINEVKSSIYTAQDLGAEDITIHPGRRGAPAPGKEFYRKILEDSLGEIGRYAERMGMRISLELMEKIPKEFVTTPEEINGLLAALAPLSCGVTLDVAHMDTTEMFFACAAAIPGVNKIHLSNRIGERLHVHAFEGDIDTTAILEYLRDKNLPVIIEGDSLSQEDLWCILRRIRLIEQKAA